MRLSSQSLQVCQLTKHLLSTHLHTKSDICKKLKIEKKAFNDLLLLVQSKLKVMGLKVIGVNHTRNGKSHLEKDVICDPLEAEKLFVTRWYDKHETKRKRISIKLQSKKTSVEKDDERGSQNSSPADNLTKDLDLIAEKNNEKRKTLERYEKVEFALPREYMVVFVILFLESGVLTLDKLITFLRQIKVGINFYENEFDEDTWTYNEDKNDFLFQNRKEKAKESPFPFSDVLINKMKREGYLNLFKDDDNQMVVAYDWRFYAELPEFGQTSTIEEFCYKSLVQGE